MGSIRSSSAKTALWKRWLPLGVVVAAIVAILALDLDRHLSFRALSDHRDDLKAFVGAHFLAALALYAAIYIVAIAASLPGGLLLTVAGGFLFGWFVGGLTVVIAATLGAVVIFLIARTALGEPLRARAGPWFRRLETGFAEDAFHYLLFLRLVPVFPFWLVNIAPAFLGVRLGTYVIATVIGIAPATFVFSFLGTGLDSIIIERQEAHAACLAGLGPVEDAATACPFDFKASSLVTTEMLVSFAALGFIALLPVALKKWRARKGLRRTDAPVPEEGERGDDG